LNYRKYKFEELDKEFSNYKISIFDDETNPSKGFKNLRAFVVNVKNFLEKIKKIEISETHENKIEYFKLNTYISKCYLIEYKFLEKKINLDDETFSERQQKVLRFIEVLLRLLEKLLSTLTVFK
jgi:hypothetical protein